MFFGIGRAGERSHWDKKYKFIFCLILTKSYGILGCFRIEIIGMWCINWNVTGLDEE